MTLDAHELEAVRRVPRFERRARAVGHHSIDLPEREWRLRDEVHRSDVVLGDIAVRVERFAVGQGELGADRSGIGDADPAVDVLAEIDHVATRSELTHFAWAEQLDPPHGRSR